MKIESFLHRKTSGNGIFLAAGPCSVESEEQVMETALGVAKHGTHLLRGGIWKPRTRPGTFEGIGEKGLQWLKNAGIAANIPVGTEVATAEHVELCLKNHIDVLWIGARTTVNPFAVQAIADALKGVNIPVMVKNPINPDLSLWIGAMERLSAVGITKLVAIHRGFSSGEKSVYRNDPQWRIPLELKRKIPDLPIICDPSHICGNRDNLAFISQEAVDLLFDGLMLEVHPNPDIALSDAAQQLTPDGFGALVKGLKPKKVNSTSADFIEHIDFLRKEIDTIDKSIIEKFAERMAISEKIATFKKREDVTAYQPQRWNEIVETRIKQGTSKNLDKDFLFRVYQLIHEESIRHQEEIE